MREPLPQRKQPRLQGYDYGQNGYYFITICTHDRANLLCTVGNAVRAFKSATTREYNRIVPTDRKNKLWQGSYYDEIIRNDAHLDAVRAYIDGNAARWSEDEYYTNT